MSTFSFVPLVCTQAQYPSSLYQIINDKLEKLFNSTIQDLNKASIEQLHHNCLPSRPECSAGVGTTKMCGVLDNVRQ